MAVSLRQAVAGTLLLVLMAGPARSAVPLTLTVRDGAGNPVPDAVVYLQGAAAPPLSVAAPVVIDQRDKIFVPAVTVIQTGTEVSFPNSDSVSHHVYSFAQPNAFELPLYKGRQSPTVRFDHAGVITLGCNIHDAMVGWIVVVDTPYFRKTDDRGTATLARVPAGKYEGFVWSPRLDPVHPISIGAIVVESAPGAATVSVTKTLRPEPAAGALAGDDY